ncbi:hypothetical protein GALL_461070 [mine drainage metagenome]|uniref:Uncharacterized protein n=1 Tax=mine drainage metagenome TaxID=410659 RepID=A0A1J5PWR8_9ZZZZ
MTEANHPGCNVRIRDEAGALVTSGTGTPPAGTGADTGGASGPGTAAPSRRGSTGSFISMDVESFTLAI